MKHTVIVFVVNTPVAMKPYFFIRKDEVFYGLGGYFLIDTHLQSEFLKSIFLYT